MRALVLGGTCLAGVVIGAVGLGAYAWYLAYKTWENT